MSEVVYPLKLYLKYKPNIILLLASLSLNIAMWIWLFIAIQPENEQFFLHYTILFGVDLIGAWYKIFFLPISGLLILIFNAAIGWLLFKSDKFFSHIMNAVSVLCHILLLIGTWLIVFLNV